MKRRDSLSVLLLSMLGSPGCSKPKPPTLSPRSARVTAVSRYAVELSVQMDARNPNSFPLIINQVTANCELPDGTLIGTANSAAAFTIPAEGDQVLDAKLSVRLESFAVLAPYAFKLKHLPYRLRGIAKVGGDRLNLDVPFSVEGVLTPQELLATGLRDAGLTLPK